MARAARSASTESNEQADHAVCAREFTPVTSFGGFLKLEMPVFALGRSLWQVDWMAKHFVPFCSPARCLVLLAFFFRGFQLVFSFGELADIKLGFGSLAGVRYGSDFASGVSMVLHNHCECIADSGSG